MHSHILLLCFVVVECSSAQIPSYFKRCYRRQKDFDECYSAAAQSAAKYLNSPIKELGLVSLDPLEIPSLSIGAGTGPAAFTQTYHNMTSYGLSKTNCSHSKIDFEKKTLESRCTTPEWTVTFDFEFEGRILLLPISGKGPGSGRLINVSHNLTLELEEYEKNGRKHWKAQNSSFVFRPEKMIFKMENLFGKDEVLNENMNRLINENWEVLFEDVGPGYGYAFAQVVKAIFNRMMRKVSISDLFGEE